MKRRDFITLASGAAVAWPFALRAQQSRTAKLGFVSWQPDSASAELTTLRQALADLGWVDGRNTEISSYFTNASVERTEQALRELLQSRVDVLVVRVTPAAQIAKQATQTVPIVLMVADALSTGLVPSLSHPGGNLTGVSYMSPDLAGKRLELLHEMKPAIRTVGFLGSSRDPNAATFVQQTKSGAERIGLTLVVELVDEPAQIDISLFASLKRQSVEAVVVQPVFSGHEDEIVSDAMKSQLPVISDFPPFARAGALFTFAADETALNRRAAYYVDRILRGSKPADLPVEQPTSFRLVINLKTAKALGITVPQTLLATADEVIE